MRIDGHEIYGANDDRAYLYDKMTDEIKNLGPESFLEVVGTVLQHYSCDLEKQIRKKLEKEITEAHQAKSDAEKMVKDMRSVLDGMKK